MVIWVERLMGGLCLVLATGGDHRRQHGGVAGGQRRLRTHGDGGNLQRPKPRVPGRYYDQESKNQDAIAS